MASMTHDEFRIGKDFWSGGTLWRCTDVGTRVIVAISLGPHEVVEHEVPNGARTLSSQRSHVSTDPDWFNGPPYAIVEHVFDEYDIAGCLPTRDEESSPG